MVRGPAFDRGILTGMVGAPWRSKLSWRPWIGLWAVLGCPSGDAGVGSPSSAGAPTVGTSGGAESSTGFDTLADGSGGGTTAAPSVLVRCAAPPPGAVGGDYDHAFEVEPESSAWTWSVDGLPEGLWVSPLGGTLSGAPSEAGTFELDVMVEGPEGIGEASCTLEIAPALSVDLSALSGPCVGPTDTLADVLVGGDGSAVTCTTPAGNGDGSRPDAVSVDAQTCAIEGAPTPEEYGTWVWITRVAQAGAEVFVPFCISQSTPPAGSFDIAMSHLGDDMALLEPLTASFEVGEALAFGGEGDPGFTILGGCGPSSCSYGFSFIVGPSPFGGDCGASDCFSLSPSDIAEDGEGNQIGFRHQLRALGPAVGESFADRPFVLPWNLTYCIAANEDDCDGNANIVANANGRVHVSLLMQPQ